MPQPGVSVLGVGWVSTRELQSSAGPPIPLTEIRYWTTRFGPAAWLACMRAIDDARRDWRGRHLGRAVVLASADGDLEAAGGVWQAIRQQKRVPPLLVPQGVLSVFSGRVARFLGAGGPNVALAVSHGGASAALFVASLLIQAQRAKQVLVVGVDLAGPVPGAAAVLLEASEDAAAPRRGSDAEHGESPLDIRLTQIRPPLVSSLRPPFSWQNQGPPPEVSLKVPSSRGATPGLRALEDARDLLRHAHRTVEVVEGGPDGPVAGFVLGRSGDRWEKEPWRALGT